MKNIHHATRAKIIREFMRETRIIVSINGRTQIDVDLWYMRLNGVGEDGKFRFNLGAQLKCESCHKFFPFPSPPPFLV